jgi:two-component system cell cycle sensor histidine kinase/response regulator CckA
MFSEHLSIWWMRLVLGAMAASWFWALSRRHPAVPGPGWWSAALVCMALPVWLPWVAWPVGTSGLLTNLLTTLSASLGWLGLRRHFGFHLPQRATWWGAVAYVAANWVLFEF